METGLEKSKTTQSLADKTRDEPQEARVPVHCSHNHGVLVLEVKAIVAQDLTSLCETLCTFEQEFD